MHVITNRVHQWNAKAGLTPAERFSPEYWKALSNQAERLQEELDELKRAIRLRDTVEVLDGQVDIDFVLQGFTYLSQFDHDKSLERVSDNNDLKLTKSFHQGMIWLEEHGEANPTEHFILLATEFDGEVFYSVHRESDNKVIKPLDHPAVNLYDLALPNCEIFVASLSNCTKCNFIIQTIQRMGYPVTVLDLDNSKADKDFCQQLGINAGDVAFFDGESCFVNKNVGFEVEPLSSWLKGVGANGKAC